MNRALENILSLHLKSLGLLKKEDTVSIFLGLTSWIDRNDPYKNNSS